MNFRKFLALAFLGFTAVSVFADEYTIAKFEGEPFGAPDDYISAEFNDELKKANPAALKDGSLYARQKFEDPFDDEATTYGLYEGKVTNTGKAKLGKFTLADRPYGSVLRMKFYSNADSRANQDIDRVYFDGQFIYVEGESPIFVRIDGQMVQLKPSIEKVGSLNVTTQPSGVEIFIAREVKGKSPSKVSVMGTKAVVVKLSKAGHYTKIIVVTPKPGATVEVSELLTPKKDLENPVSTFRVKMTEVVAKNKAKEVAVFRTSLNDRISTWLKESAQNIEKLMASYPINPAQGASETADDFGVRTLAWQNERDSEMERLKAAADQIGKDLASLLAELDQKAENSLFALRHVYIPSASIQVGRINKQAKTFEVTITGPATEGAFTYKANYALGDMTNAQLIEKAKQMQAVARLWSIPAADGSTPVLQSLVFYINQKLMTESGVGTYNHNSLSSDLSAKGKTFDAKLTSMGSSEKSAFDAESKKQTKALLQIFVEATAPVVTPPQPKPEPVVTPTPPKPTPVVETPAPVKKEEVAATEEEESEEATEEESTEAPEVADLTNTEEAAAPTEAEEQEEATEEAESDIDEQFGRQDEYRRWAGWGLIGVAAITTTVGVLQHSKYGTAKTATDNTQSLIDQAISAMEDACSKMGDQASACYDAALYNSRQPGGPMYIYEAQQKENKKIRDSYAMGRNIMLGLSVLSIAGSVVLFTW